MHATEPEWMGEGARQNRLRLGAPSPVDASTPPIPDSRFTSDSHPLRVGA